MFLDVKRRRLMWGGWFVSVVLAIGVCSYFSITKKHYEWFYFDLLEQKIENRFRDLSECTPIAHVTGEIDGKTYTNSKEALISAIDAGYKFIEIDLRKSLDGHCFGAHKIKEFNQITGHKNWFIFPPTSSQIRSRKIYGTFTPLLLTDIADILKDHPDVVLVTDKADDFELLLKEFPYPDQMIVEVSRLGQFIAAIKAGIKYPALNSTNFDFCLQHNISIVVTSVEAANSDSARRFVEGGNYVLAASYPTLKKVPDELRSPGFFAYVDSLE